MHKLACKKIKKKKKRKHRGQTLTHAASRMSNKMLSKQFGANRVSLVVEGRLHDLDEQDFVNYLHISLRLRRDGKWVPFVHYMLRFVSFFFGHSWVFSIG